MIYMRRKSACIRIMRTDSMLLRCFFSVTFAFVHSKQKMGFPNLIVILPNIVKQTE